jgi:hypothetical protein
VATKKINTKVVVVAEEIDGSQAAPFDTETHEDLGDKLISIRDVHGFANVAMTQYMETYWGAFTAIQTATDTINSKIWLYKAAPGATGVGIVPVTRGGTGNAASFSLSLPLEKLQIRPASDRQWNLVPMMQPITGSDPAFVLTITERITVPRDLKAEETAAAQAKLKEQLEKKAEELKSKLAEGNAKTEGK